MSVQEMKKMIINHLKNDNKIDSDLGVIQIHEKIGEGGNALVYNATFGRKTVAMKVLAEQKNSSKYKRFITEFREIVQLAETKAVVPIYHFDHLKVGEFEFPYIIMKKYPYTLKTWNSDNPVPDYGALSSILFNLMDIISVVHKHNIVHRDLKPENILVSENGEMVLADFGISWFDPEFYEKFIHTQKGDRIANFDFSAPEQFKKGSQPHPTMDIFALGQIVTWLITGGVARGNRPTLTEFDSSFSVIDPIVKEMLSRYPEHRPQSIQEVKESIQQIIHERDESTRLHGEIDRVIGELRMFNDTLLFCFPGKRGIIETDEANKINTVMTGINKLVEETNLWWTQGYSNCPINRKMRNIDEDTWIMDSTEIQIEKVWALKSSYSLDHQFFLIKTKAMPRFGIYQEESPSKWEEAAWYKDRYITREEFDDGVAEIDGESFWLDGEEEVRIRNFYPEYYFIGTQSHPILLPENDEVVTSIYKKLLKTSTLDDEDIERLSKLQRHKISIMMN